MKRTIMILFLVLLLTGCSSQDTIRTNWEIDFSACPLWQGVQEDNSRIYIFLSGQMIYAVENFL